MGEKVTSIFGGPVGIPEPNMNCISVLEDMLEKARSGEVIGAAVAVMHADGLSSWATGGKCVGFSLIGALEVMKSGIVEAARDDG